VSALVRRQNRRDAFSSDFASSVDVGMTAIIMLFSHATGRYKSNRVVELDDGRLDGIEQTLWNHPGE
jgi:hypothetical protein